MNAVHRLNGSGRSKVWSWQDTLDNVWARVKLVLAWAWALDPSEAAAGISC